jgi:predicted metal-dependent phosphoesterase TrpH
MARGRRAPEVDRLVPPRPTTADFHAHTTRSDGLLEPAELVAQAAAAGVRTLAIADHDTLAGCRELVAPGAAPPRAGLELIPAVEINATARELPDLPEGELHLVGLGVDPADDAFEALLDRQRDARRRRFEEMIERLREIDLPIDEALAALHSLERPADEAFGRPTIARALVHAGHARDVPDAFARIVGRGQPGYVPRRGMGPREAIGAIVAAGGIPVLAHFYAAPTLPAVLDELIELGLRGLEVHHRSFSRALVEQMAEIAARRRLLPSGGTDFHGDECTYAEAIAETWVPEEVAEGVLAALGRLPAAGTAR